ncbi:MAG: alpha-amylase, partial [Bacteroidota bacterium]
MILIASSPLGNVGSELLGLTDDVFLWSGAGSTENGNAFEFGPTGQSDFSLPYEPGRMTFEGNDIWSITITPRTYFNVPNGTPIRRLGVLLKNGDGTAQTEDFFITLFESGLNQNLMSPSLGNLFVDPGETIAVSAQSSENANWDLLVDGSSVTTQSNTDQFSFDLVAENSGSRSVELRAIAGNDTARANFNYSIVEPLPDGLQLGINYKSDTEVTLVFQAPFKDSVKAIGDFNNWDADNALLMEPVADGNTFLVELDNLTPGEEYAFQYLVYENGSLLRVADPFADKYLFGSDNEAIIRQNYPNLKAYPGNNTSGPVSVFQTAQTPYDWQVTNFTRPEPQDLVVYELLVRDFDQDKSYQNVIDRLDYLDSLGINAIELMPIMEFGGNQSWGYNPW